ncbi:Hypothetical predicted protein [Pelobates cultripes]|uniref:Uncharacterized protein n=1 Tax=Pelobates cultripes TaxID=61616 RepID=A0AAD1TFE9_PELCU|nr:Hypothetical predicted protein [Pelobates cultripes]
MITDPTGTPDASRLPPGPGTYSAVAAARSHHLLCGRTAAVREGTGYTCIKHSDRLPSSPASGLVCREPGPHAKAAQSFTYKRGSTTLHIKGPHALSGDEKETDSPEAFEAESEGEQIDTLSAAATTKMATSTKLTTATTTKMATATSKMATPHMEKNISTKAAAYNPTMPPEMTAGLPASADMLKELKNRSEK